MARRKRYNREFKLQAIRRADEPGVIDTLVADELGINARQLRRWRDAFKEDGEVPCPTSADTYRRTDYRRTRMHSSAGRQRENLSLRQFDIAPGFT